MMSGRGTKVIGIFIVVTLFVLNATGLPVFADIYMYIDDDGIMHFTNTPTSNQYEHRVYVKERKSISAKFNSTNQFDDLISNASEQFGVDFPLLKAIIKAESDFNPQAISRKGAMGLMQIMPENFKMLDLQNPFDPWQNIKAGTRYFKQLHERFNGKLTLSLAAYNAGPTAVDYYKSIPPYQETEEYVRKVLRYYRTFKHL
jgi:soluble lytic murein transglycosylase-like protein